MKPMTRDGILRGGIATLIRLLLVAAAGISGYLLSVSLSGGQVAGCGPGSSCDAVLQSRWAYVFSVPVSALALIVDLVLLLTTFSCGPKSTPKQRRGAWEILAPCAVLVLGAALWFTALQALVLKRFCPWCLAAHACGAVAAALLLTRLPVTDTPREKDPAVSRSKLMKFCAIALFAVALLGVAQTFAPGKTYSVSVVPVAPSNVLSSLPTSNVPTQAAPAIAATITASNKAAEARPATQAPVPAGSVLEVFGGQVRLDLTQVPVWGSPNAPYKLISLFDYTCSHCREMHERVTTVQRSFGDKLAVVSLPVPLDGQCNQNITRSIPAHTNACVYAKIGLAVWHAKREALLPFDDWLFAFQTPPPLADVTNKAMQLVGAEAFTRASQNPLLDRQISESVQLFTISARDYRNYQLPQFMIGPNVLQGIATTEQLRAFVGKYVDSGK